MLASTPSKTLTDGYISLSLCISAFISGIFFHLHPISQMSRPMVSDGDGTEPLAAAVFTLSSIVPLPCEYMVCMMVICHPVLTCGLFRIYPIILTGWRHSFLSYTVFWTRVIRSIISVAVAPPLFMIKPLWRVDTWAPPMATPFQPCFFYEPALRNVLQALFKSAAGRWITDGLLVVSLFSLSSS